MAVENIVKGMILLQDFNDTTEMNAVYKAYFQEPYSERLVYQVAALSNGVLVGIEAVTVFDERVILEKIAVHIFLSDS